ncbi:Rieske (2Fe-2S) protein [Streptomyces sp. NPDC058045]|uniref:Rieske (2Fe-2S) protein n=1 Tax=Streptomyces sp. NPDC058045 TaxID=3346311 RepID=UPI0036E906F2
MPSRPRPPRRTLLRGAATAPVAGLGLAACAPQDDSTVAALPTAPVDLGPEKDIPAGGARLFADDQVVVSRSGDGTCKAFSTICTHRKCVMNDLEATTLTCVCHGSKFDATSGKVLHPPASSPLIELPVRVEKGNVVVGPADRT